MTTREYRWGTNIPAIKSILETFEITGVLELGAGLNSTKIFYESNIPTTSIETDIEWINKLKPTLIENEKFKFIHHNLGIHFKRTFVQIDEKIRKDSVDFYKQYIIPDMNFLFVDHVAGLRIDALNELKNHFDVIAYHDAEEVKLYRYDLLNTEDYIHIMNKTPVVWTGILIKNKLINDDTDNLLRLTKKLKINNIEYCNIHSVKYNGTVELF